MSRATRGYGSAAASTWRTSGWSTRVASVVRPTLLYISRMLKRFFTCHPERSEGSHVFEKARFFASLRMTIKVKRFMTHYTSDSQVLAFTRGEAMGMKIIVCAKQVLDPETPSSIFSVKKRLPTPFLLHRNLGQTQARMGQACVMMMRFLLAHEQLAQRSDILHGFKML